MLPALFTRDTYVHAGAFLELPIVNKIGYLAYYLFTIIDALISTDLYLGNLPNSSPIPLGSSIYPVCSQRKYHSQLEKSYELISIGLRSLLKPTRRRLRAAIPLVFRLVTISRCHSDPRLRNFCDTTTMGKGLGRLVTPVSFDIRTSPREDVV
jgi:hypothetical protein